MVSMLTEAQLVHCANTMMTTWHQHMRNPQRTHSQLWRVAEIRSQLFLQDAQQPITLHSQRNIKYSSPPTTRAFPHQIIKNHRSLPNLDHDDDDGNDDDEEEEDKEVFTENSQPKTPHSRKLKKKSRKSLDNAYLATTALALAKMLRKNLREFTKGHEEAQKQQRGCCEGNSG